MPPSENYSIEVINEQSIHKIDPNDLLNVVQQILEYEQVSAAEISIVLMDNAVIHQWNRETLNHDFPTDVITFALNDPPYSDSNPCLEGELLVSVEIAAQLAGDVGWSIDDECTLYILHGILHLLGYDDLNESDQIIMRKKEHEVLTHLGMHPGSKDDRWNSL
ncbi:rRNA maturation RNase YbeY [Rubinisphaera sp.]|uniref:rRNA maturation RNase YbeY n=1 Tax=Rubinisphaera sp. TaxID=2024857 RepID=UPI000C0D0525|nr:rRNA maturation RNase YbeY [Rubinisphaera sp.]MBV08474.1 rRNA maturation RNase YbeY [Rubinisphaera sp.]|tara:strand:- start:1021 stop:1509 length:489 start_codon:yes stop_codon:yes gene_type:complete